MPEQAKIVIRPVQKNDQGIVFSTWLKGQYWGDDHFNLMPQNLYFEMYGDYVTSLINAKGTQIDCAVMADAPEVVLGYIVYNDQHLFWGYTKRPYRKQGIFNLLLKNMDFTEALSLTKVGVTIIKRKGLQFNPFFKESV